AYLVTIVTFVLALRFLSSPARARLGNRIGAVGMVIAVAATFAQSGVHNYVSILIVMAVFAPIGALAAQRVKMTAMPQMVALFNGVGGGAAALVALADFHRIAPDPGRIPFDVGLSIVLSALIGSVSFAGSLIAFGKLQELVSGRPITYPGQKLANGALLAALGGVGAAAHDPDGARDEPVAGERPLRRVRDDPGRGRRAAGRGRRRSEHDTRGRGDHARLREARRRRAGLRARGSPSAARRAAPG